MEGQQVKWACGKLETWHWLVPYFSSSSFSVFSFLSLSPLLSYHPYTPSRTLSTCSFPPFPPTVPLVPLSRPSAAFIFKSTECSTLLKKGRKEREEWRFESTLQQRKFMSLHFSFIWSKHIIIVVVVFLNKRTNCVLWRKMPKAKISLGINLN